MNTMTAMMMKLNITYSELLNLDLTFFKTLISAMEKFLTPKEK